MLRLAVFVKDVLTHGSLEIVQLARAHHATRGNTYATLMMPVASLAASSAAHWLTTAICGKV